MVHPLLDAFHAAANGDFPPVDGGVTYLPPLDGGRAAVVAFTGHAMISSRFDADGLADLIPDGFGGALAPLVLLRLAAGGDVGVNDVTLVAPGTGGGTLARTDRWDSHDRVQHARRLRADVVVHGDQRGFVTLAHGLAGRREMSIELAPGLHDSRVGRLFVAEARALIPAGTWLFAAVSPGNARSLRAFLAGGFTPIASEVIIEPAR